MDMQTPDLASLLMQYQQAQGRMEQAQQAPQYVQNSGYAGIASVIAQALLNNRTRHREEPRLEALAGQISQGQDAQKRDEEARTLAAELAKEQRDHKYRMEEAQAKPHAMTPVQTNQGIMGYDGYTNTATPLGGGSGGGAPSGPLMPYQAPMTPYQQASLANQQHASQRADEAAGAARDAKQMAVDDKRRKVQASAQDAYDTYSDAIKTIDNLRGHPGYAVLGTPIGDFETKIPIVRTDAKGADAQLETLKSQIMINTLGKLKQLSATGASGFGALNQSEGNALRQAIANVSTAQSHKDLDAALLRVKSVMERSQQRVAQASGLTPGAAGQVPAQGKVLRYNPQTGKIE